jgi:hypothetical protein
MTAIGQRHGLVQQGSRALDDRFAANRVVLLSAGELTCFIDGIRTIQRVVEASPSRIRGVE